MAKSKKKKGKKKHTSPEFIGEVEIEPCPFCASGNVLLEKGSIHDECSNIVMICLECKTQFELPFLCTNENIVPALKFWNDRRCPR